MALAYYNEIDPFAAQWLRNLIQAGLIASGDVDERSIEDVRPADLAKYTQCHFFAGIGGWSYALRLAGWPDDRPVWTGSCPCQPFSTAGKELGFADERHLWPAWNHLVRECRPSVIFGEQVEAAIRHGWLDLVQADLEGEGYRFGAAGLPAAGVGAPHGRARLWFVAESECQRSQCEPKQRCRGLLDAVDATEGSWEPVGAYGASDGSMADSPSRNCSDRWPQRSGEQRLRAASRDGDGSARNGERAETGDLAHPNGHGTLGPRAEEQVADAGCAAGNVEDSQCPPGARLGQYGGPGLREQEADGFTGPSSLGGWWRDAEWLWCRDQKYRPVEPGVEPLAHGVPARVGRLRGYGNSIVPQVAAEFIRAFVEAREEGR